jgi:autotransporter-associated beta strand protein
VSSSGGLTVTLRGSTAGTGEIAGVIPSTANVTKSGTGTWYLSASNTYSGVTTVNAGNLIVAGTNAAIRATTGLTLNGGSFVLLNTATSNQSDRLADSLPITLNGGAFCFSNDLSAAVFSETVGALTVNSGASTIAATQAATDGTSTVYVASLTRNPGATVNFAGEGLGDSDRNRIFIAGQGDGLIGTWATVNGTRYAAYSSARGVYAASETVDIAARGYSVITNDTALAVRISTPGESGPITLETSPVSSVGSLTQNSDTPATVTTTNTLFKVAEIVLAADKADLTVGTAPREGTLSVFSPGGRLLLENNCSSNVLTVNASIVSNSAACSLSKTGVGKVVLAGENTYGGATLLNKGDLVFGSGNHAIGQLSVGTASFFLTNAAASYVYVTNNSAYIGNNAGEFGRMALAGNSSWSGYLYPKGVSQTTLVIGNSGRGILTLQDNASVTQRLYVGNNAGSAGAVYQNGGTMHNWGGSSSDPRIGMYGYGYYELNSGTFTNMGWTHLGFGVQSIGILRQTGGAFKMGNVYDGRLGISRGGTGVVHVAGGTFAASDTLDIGEQWDNSSTNGFAEFTMTGGRADINGDLYMADRYGSLAVVNLNGGTLAANRFMRAGRIPATALVNFDGGTFRARSGGNLFGTGTNTPNAVSIYDGGVIFDTTNLTCTIPVPLQAPAGSGVASIGVTPRAGYIGPPMVIIAGGGGTGATAVAQFDSASGTVTGIQVTSPGFGYTSTPTVTLAGGGTNVQTAVGPVTLGANVSGGLTKLGAGSLTLKGACGFTGPTVVSAGALALPGSFLSGSLTASAGAAVSLANGVIQTQQLGTAVLPSGVTVAFDALPDGSACDQIGLPVGATVGDLSIAVVQAGTAMPASRAGDYPLFTFAGSAPAVSGWTLLNPPEGRAWSFEVVGATVVLRLTYDAGVSIWTNAGSGDWETAGNWTEAPADAAGTSVRFDGAITAPATVARASASAAGSVVFNNVRPYTLAGAALTLANLGDAPAVIEAELGVHAVSASLLLTSNALVRAAAGAAVALNGGVSGGTALTVEGPGALALPDAGGVAVSGLSLEAAAVLVVSNSAALALPVSLGAGGGVLAPAAGRSLDLTAAVSGAGSLTKESSSFLNLTNANALYTGATRVRAGTLRLDGVPGGGVVFGQGTLHYVGGAAVTASGYTLDTGDNTRAGVLRADGDLTFQGAVSAVSGALVKTGPGTVTFTAPGLNVFNAGNGAGTSHNVLDIGPNGDSPTTGFSGFNVADGKVAVGAPGQTNVFNGLLVVGLNTTTNADAETAGQLEVSDGVTTVGEVLIVGRSNGYTNTAAVARTSRLRLTGGGLSTPALVLGRVLNAAGHASAPEVEIAGGLLSASNAVVVGEAAGVIGTVRLTGGALAAPNVTRGGGQAHLLFDGGAFRPTAEGQTLQNLTSARVGAGGAPFDLSQTASFTLGQALTTDGADGGVTKTGAGKLIVSARQSYAGPTLVSEGTLLIPVSGGLSNVTALTVAPGAALELDAANTQTVSVASLTLGAPASAPASVTMALFADGTANDRLAVSGPLSLGAVSFTLVRGWLADAYPMNGTYTLITYAGTDPDTSELSVANPAYGKRYTFAAAAGALTVTVATDYTGAAGGAIWNVATGGSWSEAGNWVVAPGAGGAGQPVRFDDKIAAPATVTLDSPATVGQLFFNNANAYALAGSAQLSFDNGAGTQALVSVEAGSHAVTAPVSVPAEGLRVHTVTGAGLTLGASSGDGPLVKTSGGTLTAAAASDRTGSTEIQSGELVLRDGGTVGSGELVLNGTVTVRAAGSAPAALANTVTFKGGAPTLRPEEQALTLSGALDWQTGVGVAYKWGTNELVLAGTGGAASGTPKLYVRQGGVTLAPGASYTLPGATRESVKLGLTANTRATLTVESGAALSAGGILVSAEAAGTVGNEIAITQNGGSVALNNTSDSGGDALFLRDFGTAPATFVMNGGTFSMPPASWANVGNFGPGRLTVNGGAMTLGRFAAGYQTTNLANGGSAEVTVNGGRLAAAGSWSWMSDGGARATYVRLNGGTLALPATRTYGTNVNRWAELRLAGGTLETTGAALDTAATDDYLSGVRRVALDRAGGTVDTKGLSATVRQSVLSLSATGGVAKAGAGSLTLSGTNHVRGLVDVQEGTLSARFANVSLPSAPLFWFGMNGTDNPDLSGNGIGLSVSGAATFSLTNRTPTAQALGFSGAGYFTAAHNPHFTNVTDFTVAVWVLLTNTVSGTSNFSILSARPGSGAGDRAFELKMADGNVVRILQHSFNAEAWWQEFRTVNTVPVGQRTHIAVSLTPQGVAMYLNGVRQSPIKQVYTSGGTMRDYPGSGYYYPGDFRFVPAGRTGGLIIGRPTSGAGPGFNGAMDDLLLFERALTDAEVAALAGEAPVRPASVRVAWRATLDLQGAAQPVAQASGSGQVVNGTLSVQERLSPGDAEDEAPGALLSVANLTLGTNVVYACTGDGTVNDLTAVGGLLTVAGPGTISFGRTPENPITQPFTATVMTYGALDGATNLPSWRVTGLGRNGFAATVSAADGRVEVSLKALWGSLMLLK